MSASFGHPGFLKDVRDFGKLGVGCRFLGSRIRMERLHAQRCTCCWGGRPLQRGTMIQLNSSPVPGGPTAGGRGWGGQLPAGVLGMRSTTPFLGKGRGCQGWAGGATDAARAMEPGFRVAGLRQGNFPTAVAVFPHAISRVCLLAPSGASTARMLCWLHPRRGRLGTQAAGSCALRPPAALHLSSQVPSDCATPCASASSGAFSLSLCCW